MKKLLTISVAAYNAASTLEECLQSMCLDERHMDELEVIITDDGSTDQGPQIVEGFIEKYPGTFRLISQENKGYGSSLENSLTRGRGLYFRVVDGDDKVDTQGLESLLDRIEELNKLRGKIPDLIVTPFFTWRSRKESPDDRYTIVENHTGLSPDPASIEESDLSRGLAIFEITCRRAMVLEACHNFPHHCFYVDNQLVMVVLLNTRTLCYLNSPVSIYRTDRPDQSMSQDFLASHFSDTVKISRLVFSMYLEKNEDLKGGKKVAVELLISSMARLEWLTGLLSSRPLRYRRTLKKRYRAIQADSPDLFHVTRRSRIARSGMEAGPLGFLVMSAFFKIEYRIFHWRQVVYFAKKNTSRTE